MRILLPALLTFAALAAIAPSSTAVAICSTQTDASDLILGDDPIAKETCTTENIISYDCDLVVAVNQDGSVTRTLHCDPLIYCVTEPCPGPIAASSSAADPLAATPCSGDLNPTDDNGVSLSCTAAGATCSAGALAFGPWPDALLWGPACTGLPTVKDLWPPYDCVQDCDGPPVE